MRLITIDYISKREKKNVLFANSIAYYAGRAYRKEASHIYCKAKGLKEALNERDSMKELGDLSVNTKFVGGDTGKTSFATVMKHQNIHTDFRCRDW
jgi:hypothetical protein